MDKYILRREILEIVKSYAPAPLDADSITSYPKFRVLGLPREKIVEELRGLASHGYLEDLRPGREPLYSITAKGRDQADMESDLDEYVWGEMASKFQR